MKDEYETYHGNAEFTFKNRLSGRKWSNRDESGRRVTRGGKRGETILSGWDTRNY